MTPERRWSRAVSIVSGANDDTIDLNGPHFYLSPEPAPSGLFGAPTSTVRFQRFAGDGSRRGRARRDMTETRFAVHIIGGDAPHADELRRRLIEALSTDRGSHRIQVRAADGSIRESLLDIVDGLDDLAVATSESAEMIAQLVGLRAPYWVDTADAEIRTQLLFPGGGSAPSRIYDIPVAVGGTAETWPLWRAVGPLSEVVTCNLTTGDAWQWSPAVPIAAGEVLEVDTAEGVKSVTVDGLNDFRSMVAAPGQRLWPFIPGRSNDLLVILGDTGATTQFEFSWRNRWRSC